MKLLYVCDNGFCEKENIVYASPADSNMIFLLERYFDDFIIISRKGTVTSSYKCLVKEYPVYFIDKYDVRLLCKYLKDNLGQVNAVMCFGTNGYFAQFYAKKYNKKVISYIGGDNSETLWSMKTLKGAFSAPVFRCFDYIKCRNADYVHYCSELFAKRYPTDGKILCCSMLGINIDEAILDKRKKNIYNMNQVVTIGLIGYVDNAIKGVDLILKACGQIKKSHKIKLQIVGSGNWKIYNNLITKLDVYDIVEFLGTKKNGKELFAWLDSIDIYVQPSRTEGLPKATVEAMSRGCPVVASSVGALPDLIDSNYLVERGDYKTLSEKIINLIDNKTLCLEQSIRNFETSHKYSISVRDQKLDAFYLNIIKNL